MADIGYLFIVIILRWERSSIKHSKFMIHVLELDTKELELKNKTQMFNVQHKLKCCSMIALAEIISPNENIYYGWREASATGMSC